MSVFYLILINEETKWKDENGKSQNKKLSGQPKPQHLDIYWKLQITNPLLDFTL